VKKISTAKDAKGSAKDAKIILVILKIVLKSWFKTKFWIASLIQYQKNNINVHDKS